MRTPALAAILTLVALPAAPPARADEPRSRLTFASADGRYELAPTDASRATWTMWDRRTGEARYEIRDDAKDWWRRRDEKLAGARVPGELSSQTILVSDDGSTIVVIDDWPERVEAPGGGEILDFPWLRFFREGILVKAYRRSEFLRNDCSLSESVSHFQWMLPPVPRALPQWVIEFTTTDLTTFRFNAQTGSLLAREVPPELRQGAILATVEVMKPKAGRRELVVSRAVVGAARAGDALEVLVDEDDPLVRELDGRRRASVVVVDGKLHPLTRKVAGVLFNFNAGATCR